MESYATRLTASANEKGVNKKWSVEHRGTPAPTGITCAFKDKWLKAEMTDWR